MWMRGNLAFGFADQGRPLDPFFSNLYELPVIFQKISPVSLH